MEESKKIKKNVFGGTVCGNQSSNPHKYRFWPWPLPEQRSHYL